MSKWTRKRQNKNIHKERSRNVKTSTLATLALVFTFTSAKLSCGTSQHVVGFIGPSSKRTEHVLFQKYPSSWTRRRIPTDDDTKVDMEPRNMEKLSSSIHIRHYPLANGHSKDGVNGRSRSSTETPTFQKDKKNQNSHLRIKAIQPYTSHKETKMIDTQAINHIMQENRTKKNRGYIPPRKDAAPILNQDATTTNRHNNSSTTNISPTLSIRNMWKRRHARSIEEGIRREQSTTIKLTNLLLQQNTNGNTASDSSISSSKDNNKKKNNKRNYAARTIAGLISALAEEATGLEVHVDTRNDTPLWRKQIDGVKIQFSRLGFKPLRMGALDEALSEVSGELTPNLKEVLADRLESKAGLRQDGLDRISLSKTADEVFDQIDTDKSGALDSEELARALSIASGLPVLDNDQAVKDQEPSSALSHLTTQLVKLYDTNGDGVIDREEYRRLVEDMTEIRNAQRLKNIEKWDRKVGGIRILRWTRVIQNTLRGLWSSKTSDDIGQDAKHADSDDSSTTTSSLSLTQSPPTSIDFEHAENISDASIMNTVYNGEGSIYFSGLKLDLRQLLFGVFPLIKRVRNVCIMILLHLKVVCFVIHFDLFVFFL
jgi:hypothetical protein